MQLEVGLSSWEFTFWKSCKKEDKKDSLRVGRSTVPKTGASEAL